MIPEAAGTEALVFPVLSADSHYLHIWPSGVAPSLSNPILNTSGQRWLVGSEGE